jgi:periplasmic protein TonB
VIAPTAALPAAPVQGPATSHIDPSDADLDRGGLALLERKKRYPAAAHARRDQGVAQVSFTMDRQGHQLNTTITATFNSRVTDQLVRAGLNYKFD